MSSQPDRNKSNRRKSKLLKALGVGPIPTFHEPRRWAGNTDYPDT
jgi:hypothetical protein